MKTPVYPEVAVIVDHKSISISSFVRKNLDDVWYLSLHKYPYLLVPGDTLSREQDIIRSLNYFHKQVYDYLFLGVVTPDVFHPSGEPLYTKDSDQQSEIKRLSNLILKS